MAGSSVAADPDAGADFDDEVAALVAAEVVAEVDPDDDEPLLPHAVRPSATPSTATAASDFLSMCGLLRC